MANWPGAVLMSLEDAVIDKTVETVRQQVAGDPDLVADLGESTATPKDGSKHQKGPSVANDVERGADRVVESGVGYGHSDNVDQLVANCN